MSGIATAVVGSAIIGGSMAADAAKSAAGTQASAANAASQASLTATRETNAQQLAMYNQNIERQQPYVQAGLGSLAGLQAGLAPGGQFTQTFKPSDLTTDPSYQFRLQQGTQNLNASAAARGLMGSGQNLKDITDYGQGAASQEYQAAFNRYNTNQSNLYNRMAGMATMSQNAAAGIGTQGVQVAQNMGQNTMAGTAASSNYLTSGAAAQAAGQVGQANAWSGALQSGLGNWMGVQNMNATQQYLNNMSGGAAPIPANMTGFNTPTTQPWVGSAAGSTPPLVIG